MGLRSLCLLVVLAFIPGDVVARGVRVSWYPSASATVVGYKVYVGRAGAGPLDARPIDVGRPPLDAQGVARVVFTELDLTAPRLAIEMTAYDASGRESARSNRVTLPGDGETTGTPLWSSDFGNQSLGSSPPGFFDYGGDFSVDEFYGGGPALASPEVSTGRLSASSFLGSASRSWGPHEIEGRLLTLVGGTVAGIAARVAYGDLRSAFLLGAGSDGVFVLDQVGKPGLTCEDGDSTDVQLVRFQWNRFRLRYTDPGGRVRLRAKVWNSRDLEPSSWQADCWTSQPDPHDSSVFALFHTGSGVTFWDDLVVRPITGGVTDTPFQ